jgi:hypothetical protein
VRQYNIAAAHDISYRHSPGPPESPHLKKELIKFNRTLLFFLSLFPSLSISLSLCFLSFYDALYLSGCSLALSVSDLTLFLLKNEILRKKNPCHSQDRTPDFSVAFKCLTHCDTDTCYIKALHLWLLSYYTTGERESQQVDVSNMRRYKRARRAALHHMMYRRIRYIAAS